MHGADEHLAGRLAMQQMQEVAADRVVVGLDVDPLAVMRVVEPVEQCGAEAGHQAIDDVARAWLVLIVLLRQHAAQRRHRGAHHVHWMRGRGQRLQRLLHRSGQSAQRRQFAVHQQVGDLLELAGLGDVQDVVTAIVQVVAGAADGAQCGVAGGDAGQADALLRPVWGGSALAHGVLLAE